jgi:hypothetical protein
MMKDAKACFSSAREIEEVIIIYGAITMSTSTQEIDTQIISRRRSLRFSGLALRMLIAFIVSWLVIMAFFVTGAVSR